MKTSPDETAHFEHNLLFKCNIDPRSTDNSQFDLCIIFGWLGFKRTFLKAQKIDLEIKNMVLRSAVYRSVPIAFNQVE
jgi:hypothetical protein